MINLPHELEGGREIGGTAKLVKPICTVVDLVAAFAIVNDQPDFLSSLITWAHHIVLLILSTCLCYQLLTGNIGTLAIWFTITEAGLLIISHFSPELWQTMLPCPSFKIFGTSGYKIRCFVAEIWPFEVGICVRADFTM